MLIITIIGTITAFAVIYLVLKIYSLIYYSTLDFLQKINAPDAAIWGAKFMMFLLLLGTFIGFYLLIETDEASVILSSIISWSESITTG